MTYEPQPRNVQRPTMQPITTCGERSGKPQRFRSVRFPHICALAIALFLPMAALPAQTIKQLRGVDSRVDYASLRRFGPWDDRNYQLTQEDLALLAPNEDELGELIPAFFRVAMRRANPDLPRTGRAQYPRSALQVFLLKHGGYLFEGKLYQQIERTDGHCRLILEDGVPQKVWEAEKSLQGEVRVSHPSGASESAIKINPVNPDLVIAGSNRPGTGQIMHYSTDGGETWTQAAALPGGNTCCDPTVDWSADGSFAYTASLGDCGNHQCEVWFYRSADGGQTWDDLSGTHSRRKLSENGTNDKEYIHVDKHPGSPFVDSIYATWHRSREMEFARSTDFGETWTRQAISSNQSEQGIGSDITTGTDGDIYFFWPATESNRILLRRSTDGGASFGPVIEVAATKASFDFPVPSMDSRNVFVYVSADTDYSDGDYSGSIYAAWFDATATTGSNPNHNHARIRVAYSRDQGQSWQLTTPHEIADANLVDRWHSWLAVGPDGAVQLGTTSVRGRTLLVGRTDRQEVTDDFETFAFLSGTTIPNPVFIADLQTFDGPDPATVRRRHLTSTSLVVRVEKEQSKDSETDHVGEKIGFLVISE